MKVIIVFSAIAVFSALPIVSSLRCYYCLGGNISGGSKSTCDPDNMNSADCGDSSNYVHTDYGYLPREIALALGFTGPQASVNNIDFRCAKFVKSGSEEIEGTTISYDIMARGCLGGIPGTSTNMWDFCERSDDCYLCDSDDCNGASMAASSLIFLILALFISYYNVSDNL